MAIVDEISIDKKLQRLERQIKHLKSVIILLPLTFFIMAPSGSPPLNNTLKPNAGSNIPISEAIINKYKPKYFETIVVNKLLVKDKSGNNVLLEIGAEDITSDMNTRSQSGFIRIAHTGSEKENLQMNARNMQMTRHDNSIVMNGKSILVENRANKNKINSTELALYTKRGNKQLVLLKGASNNSQLKLSSSTGSDVTLVASKNNSAKIIMSDVPDNNRKLTLGKSENEFGLVMTELTGRNSLKAVLKRNNVPAVTLSNVSD